MGMKNCVLAMTLLLGCGHMLGCSQNHSDKEGAAALAEKGLQRIDGVDQAPQVAAAKAPAPAGQAGRQSLGGISVVVPQGWESVPPASRMRVAEYHLSGADANAEKAVLAVFSGQMGSVEANIERWIGQISQPDGTPSAERAKRWRETLDGMAATSVDVRGTFASSMGPGAGSPSPDYRMIGVIVEGAATSFYLKLLGPEQTVALWEDSFADFVKSIRRE